MPPLLLRRSVMQLCSRRSCGVREPQRHHLAARVRAFVDFVALSLNQQATAGKQ
jgi:hypothetical protein